MPSASNIMASTGSEIEAIGEDPDKRVCEQADLEVVDNGIGTAGLSV